MTKRSYLLPLLLAAVAGLAACASTGTSANKVADTGEYEYVTPLGSNIPVKVRKGSTAQTASPTSSMTGEQAEQMIHRAGGNAPMDTGSR